MKRVALITSFALTSFVEIALFVTTNSYAQLTLAILLYIPLVYFGLRLFPRKIHLENQIDNQNIPKNDLSDHSVSEEINTEEISVGDIDRRAFLKILGATGLSFFVSSLLSRRVENLVLGKGEESGPTTLQDASGKLINPAEHYPTDDYKITEVDYGIETYYGFIDRGEGWFIMKEDMNAGTYRYIKGDSDFRSHWENRENLKYDYYNRVFPRE